MTESQADTPSRATSDPVELRERALLTWGVIETLLEQSILHYFQVDASRTDMFDMLTDRLTARDKIDLLTAILDHSGEPGSHHDQLRGHLIGLRDIVSALGHGYSLTQSDEGVIDIHATRYGRTREYQIDPSQLFGELSTVSAQLGSIVSYWKDRSAPFQQFLASSQRSG
jgi:hypothetical protein